MQKYLIIFLVCLVWGCKDENLEQRDLELQKVFLNQSNTGIYQGESPIILFQSDIHQMSYTNDYKNWRIQTDNQSEYFSCSLDKTNEINQITTATILTKGIKELSEGKQIAILLKIEKYKYWLWLPESDTGIIMQFNYE